MSARRDEPAMPFAEPKDAKFPGETLRDLAIRLTPNPALTVEGTLQMILAGIYRIDDDALARALAQQNARQAGLDAGPLSDEQWRAGDIQAKLALLRAAQALKAALRSMV